MRKERTVAMEKVASYTLFDNVAGNYFCTKVENLQFELKCSAFLGNDIKLKLYILSCRNDNLLEIRSEKDITQHVHQIINVSLSNGRDIFHWGSNSNFVINTRFLILVVFASVNCSIRINHTVKCDPHCLIIMPNSHPETWTVEQEDYRC